MSEGKPAPTTEEPEPAAPEMTPPEAELAGLGMIVTLLRNMTTQERWEVLNYLDARYGSRVNVEVPAPPLDYTPGQVNDLTVEILRARRRSIELGSHALAKILLDAGWRKTGDTK